MEGISIGTRKRGQPALTQWPHEEAEMISPRQMVLNHKAHKQHLAPDVNSLQGTTNAQCSTTC
eukprot:9389322-Prorocentrum_lima.AAC.1